ncbi:MAG: hypothetical protein M3Z46_06490 [Actinomycetota bacterium]|nr:hypothetical protein [Actinomycetota bacterium]
MSHRHRHRRPALLAGVVACALVLATCSSSKSASPRKPVSCAVTPELVSGCGVWWGAYVAPNTGDDADATAVRKLEHQVDRRLAIVHRYHDMSSGRRGLFPDPTERALGTDRLLFIAWASRVYGGVNYRWRDIANGSLDASVIDPAARRVAAYGRQLFIDFDHEPENQPHDGTSADFVAAYRHIHDRFQALGATNAIWVWTVTGFKDHWDQYGALYPGDDVVGWVAWDPYDFGACHQSGEQSVKDTIAPFYDWLVDHHANKPFMLAEYGTVADPADPAPAVRWYREMISVLKDRPHIRAVVQFDHHPGLDTGTGCDTRLRPPSVLQAWAAAGLDPYANPPMPP